MNYHRLQGKTSRTLGWKGPKEARKLIEQGIEIARTQEATTEAEA